MDLFKATLFLVAALTSLACMLLLFRAYTASRRRVLLWSALCFVALTINNVLLFVDLVLLPASVDLRVLRHAVALTGVIFMLYGFISESE